MTAAVGERVGRRVQDPHQQRPRPARALLARLDDLRAPRSIDFKVAHRGACPAVSRPHPHGRQPGRQPAVASSGRGRLLGTSPSPRRPQARRRPPPDLPPAPTELGRHRRGDTARGFLSAASGAPASSPRRVRRSSTSATERACSKRAATSASTSRSACPPRSAARARALGAELEHLLGEQAVAAREVLARALVDALDLRQARRVDRMAERDLVRAAGRLAELALDEPVDDHLRHPPPGRELAAGDRDHSRRGLVELGLARDVDALLRIAGRDQRPHARVGAGDVVEAEVALEEAVDRVQQVLRRRRSVGLRMLERPS